MISHRRKAIPSLSTLIAFETAGRLRSFSRAAEELQTSQSAVSRHIAGLEEQIAVRVFDRSRTGVRLNEAGSRLYDGVSSGLETIERAIAEAGEVSNEDNVVISCSHDAWQLVFMPRLDELWTGFDGHSRVRFSPCAGDPGGAPPGPDADLSFTWDGRGAGPESLALRETVGPVCSPEYAARNSAIRDRSVGAWSGLTLLDCPVPERRWASWDDWFEVEGRPEAPPRMLELDSYGDVLRAAAAGQGVALGWRYWIERHVEAGVLVPLASGWVELDNFYYGRLTEKGRRRPLARDCLAFVARSIQDRAAIGGAPTRRIPGPT